MKTRADIYRKEAASLIRDITMYRVLTKEQILRLYPGKREKIEKLLSYLTRQGRIYLVDGLYCAAPEQIETMDRGLFAAVWVLVDFIDQVEYHTAGDYPAEIIFFANGEAFEIVHAAAGKEVLLSNVLAHTGEAPPRYLVLVDTPEQIEQLQIPNVCGYCTVSPEGEVRYYQKE